MHTERNVTRRAGFTLVELLVVIAIIALLAAMLTPAIIGAMRRGHDTKTMARIHQCELAAQAFFNDYGDYPPTHWDELDEFLKYDSDGGGYDRADDEVFFVGTLDDTTSPSTVNEGIEVFLACVATQTGGPYLEPDGEWLRNVDYTDLAGDLDTAADDVARATNWYLNPNSSAMANGDPFEADPIFEVVDWWGNPLVYVHNRDYTDYDGWDAGWDPSEDVVYANREGGQMSCYARSYRGTVTDNYPNLNSFQLYSWGDDEMAGCLEDPDDPGMPVEPEPGWWPGWTKASGNLTNWEE